MCSLPDNYDHHHHDSGSDNYDHHHDSGSDNYDHHHDSGSYHYNHHHDSGSYHYNHHCRSMLNEWFVHSHIHSTWRSCLLSLRLVLLPNNL